MILVFELLKGNGCVVLNKAIMKILGIEPALLLGELLSEYAYYEDREELTEDGYFFSKSENIEKNTTLSYYKQSEALKVLQSYGLVETELRGVPARKYFCLDLDNILKFTLSDFKNFENKDLKGSSFENSQNPVLENFENSYKNKYRDNKNNSICVSEVKKEAKQKDVKNLSPLKALEVYKEEFDLSPVIVEALREFIDMRRRNKNNITALGLRRDLLKLFKLSTDPEEQIKIIYQSIDKCWKGFFELKDETRYVYPNQKRYDRTAEPEEDDVIERLKAKYKAEEEAKKRAEGGL